MAILAEAGEQFALHLLRALRLVHAWSRVSGAEGTSAFPDTPAVARWASELAECSFDGMSQAPLAHLASELARTDTDSADGLANACLAVSEWSLEAGLETTALLFTEAAALAAPANARFAWTAGRMLRNFGEMRRAELWLRRAERIAVWTGDVEVHGLALNSLGNLYVRQGAFPNALATLNRALNVARRIGRERCGAVMHDLFTLYIMMGQHTRAEEAALAALDLYGPEHPILPKLAHDVAGLWLRQGRFRTALPVLQALKPYLALPEERLRVAASIARAGAALHDLGAYEASRAEAWELVRDAAPAVRATAPAALVELGYAAATLGEWDEAEHALKLALEAATARSAHEDASSAEDALTVVRTRVPMDRAYGPSHGSARRLSVALVHTLERSATGTSQMEALGDSAT
ncbi:MAG: tetratricopeptide repeat protein [Gemmatimonadetes bacterium]|nr:tetratricopeptide repeat protein [Gemmatimonadota bacterium]